MPPDPLHAIVRAVTSTCDILHIPLALPLANFYPPSMSQLRFLHTQEAFSDSQTRLGTPALYFNRILDVSYLSTYHTLMICFINTYVPLALNSDRATAMSTPDGWRTADAQ